MQAMNVLQRPRDREFCGTMQDYVIDTEVSILLLNMAEKEYWMRIMFLMRIIW